LRATYDIAAVNIGFAKDPAAGVDEVLNKLTTFGVNVTDSRNNVVHSCQLHKDLCCISAC
jgi:hypothetical protein